MPLKRSELEGGRFKINQFVQSNSTFVYDGDGDDDEELKKIES